MWLMQPSGLLYNVSLLMHPSESDPDRSQWRRSLNESQVRALAAEYRMGSTDEACEDANEEYLLRYKALDDLNITPLKDHRKRKELKVRRNSHYK